MKLIITVFKNIRVYYLRAEVSYQGASNLNLGCREIIEIHIFKKKRLHEKYNIAVSNK